MVELDGNKELNMRQNHLSISLLEAVETGARPQILETLRNRLAADLDNTTDPRDVAVLASRFTDVLTQLDQIAPSTQTSVADEIAKRRASRRRAGAANKARAARSG